MSYPTFSFGCICGLKFQNPCLYITGYLQLGTHLYIHSLQLEVRAGFQGRRRVLKSGRAEEIIECRRHERGRARERF